MEIDRYHLGVIQWYGDFPGDAKGVGPHVQKHPDGGWVRYEDANRVVDRLVETMKEAVDLIGDEDPKSAHDCLIYAINDYE